MGDIKDMLHDREVLELKHQIVELQYRISLLQTLYTNTDSAVISKNSIGKIFHFGKWQMDEGYQE